MYTNYSEQIGENNNTLANLERRMRGQKNAVRIQMLRLLKSGKVTTMDDCAFMIGYSARTTKRWWKMYREGGLPALLEETKYRGKESQLDEIAAAGLRQAVKAGEIHTLEGARRYLRIRHGVDYQSVNGVWHMLRRYKIKLR